MRYNRAHDKSPHNPSIHPLITNDTLAHTHKAFNVHRAQRRTQLRHNSEAQPQSLISLHPHRHPPVVGSHTHSLSCILRLILMASENAIKFPSLINLISLHKQLTIIRMFFKLSSFMHEVCWSGKKQKLEVNFHFELNPKNMRSILPSLHDDHVCMCFLKSKMQLNSSPSRLKHTIDFNCGVK